MNTNALSMLQRYHQTEHLKGNLKGWIKYIPCLLFFPLSTFQFFLINKTTLRAD